MRLRWFLLAPVAGLAVWIGLYPADWQAWLGFSHNAYFKTGQSYAFFSGIGPVLITSIGLSTIIAGAWHHLNCGAPGCARIGHHPDSRGIRWCWTHHPDYHGERPSLELLHRLHHDRKNR